MSENNDDALEKLAMEEILKEAKRNADRAKEMGSLGWQKPNISTNKRFLNNMLVSTLRHPIRRNRKFSNDHKKKGDYQDYADDNSVESSKEKKSERKHSSDYDQNSKFYDKDLSKRYDKVPIKEKREKQDEFGSLQDWVQPKNGLMPYEKPPKNFEELYHADYMEYIENYKKHMEFYSELEKRTQHQLEYRVQDSETRKRPKSRFDSNSNDLGDNEDLKLSDELSTEKNSKESDQKTLPSVSDVLASETSKSSDRKRKRENKRSNSCKKAKLDSVVLKTKSKRKRRKSDRKEKKNKRKSKTGRRISVGKDKTNISGEMGSPQKLKLLQESDSNKHDEQQTTNDKKGNEAQEATGSNSEKDKDKKRCKRVKHKKSSSKRRHKRHHKTKS